mmetsp:Transcript_313/g.601  ORF Transcript_313/g.601 Transcript_313/m.601 type:complete len:248 (+) Transcript_313:272-1015(+)
MPSLNASTSQTLQPALAWGAAMATCRGLALGPRGMRRRSESLPMITCLGAQPSSVARSRASLHNRATKILCSPSPAQLASLTVAWEQPGHLGVSAGTSLRKPRRSAQYSTSLSDKRSMKGRPGVSILVDMPPQTGTLPRLRPFPDPRPRPSPSLAGPRSRRRRRCSGSLAVGAGPSSARNSERRGVARANNASRRPRKAARKRASDGLGPMLRRTSWRMVFMSMYTCSASRESCVEKASGNVSPNHR